MPTTPEPSSPEPTTPGPTTPEPTAAPHRTAPSRRLDPAGKRALFEMPPKAARDQLRSGPAKEGRAALFSGPPPATRGTVSVTCSSCETTTRIRAADLGLRLLTGSLWNPLKRSHPTYLRCPACDERTWCALS